MEPIQSRSDWRGWLGVAWAVLWGIAYAAMVIHARGPQMLRFFRW